uniref:Uncharacterized protein n=1 Tax=Rhizophora mucronata TaxID=61149 RepID=A0A2P2NGM0_RHIMU
MNLFSGFCFLRFWPESAVVDIVISIYGFCFSCCCCSAGNEMNMFFFFSFKKKLWEMFFS